MRRHGAQQRCQQTRAQQSRHAIRTAPQIGHHQSPRRPAGRESNGHLLSSGVGSRGNFAGSHCSRRRIGRRGLSFQVPDVGSSAEVCQQPPGRASFFLGVQQQARLAALLEKERDAVEKVRTDSIRRERRSRIGSEQNLDESKGSLFQSFEHFRKARLILRLLIRRERRSRWG